MSKGIADQPHIAKHEASGAPSGLIALSSRLGRDPHLVQGGGGNTSQKLGNDFWVKASGTWLAHAEDRDIFVRLSLDDVRAAMTANDSERALTLLAPDGAARPSIETSLHALLPHSVVLHVHSVNAIAWAVRPDAETALAHALAGLSWSWIPYRRPGLPLTEAIRQTLDAAAAPPDLLLLGNHGVVVGGGDVAAAEALLMEVEHRLVLPARAPPACDPDALRAANDAGWNTDAEPLLHAIGVDPVACAVALHGALYPDHVVFLGERALSVDATRRLSTALVSAAETGMPEPVYAVVPGAGILLSPRISAGARAMLGCLAEVGLRLGDARTPEYLGPADVAALMGWEAEAHRRKLDRPAAASNG